MSSFSEAVDAPRRGAVSIFMVIFVALVVSVMTVAFVRIALRDRGLAVNQDLSQSAYDAALAGVEDGKRALSRYYAASNKSVAPYYRVNTPARSDCNDVNAILGNSFGERRIESGGADMEQAYTCAQLSNRVDDFRVSLQQDEQVLFPLPNNADSILIEWAHVRDDGGTGATPFNVPTGTVAPSTLPTQASWAAYRPALLETQLIQAGGTFTLDSFNNIDSGRSNSNTLFLYPLRLAAPSSANFTSDVRRASGSTTHPTPAQCTQTPNPNGDGAHSCAMRITLPSARDTGAVSARFLRLSPRYAGNSIKVTAYRAGVPVPFIDVQVKADVTARANDVYRRVEVRLDSPNVMYPGTSDGPGAAVNIRGNLCKVFRVAADPVDYLANRTICEP
ncbi:MAG TPA: hypothetical protein PKD28_02855 [Candidatus Saccharibacteria bacterium]|nr:hypothetical protein [Candidatus Saccharibacteria bacterium]